tara:strand:+ start:187 stop:384 length:198 start_codon:yes stop_codon:yes gene_type:complete
LRFHLRIIAQDVDLENTVLFLDIREMRLEQIDNGQVPMISIRDRIRKSQGKSADYSSIAAFCALW